MATIIDRSRLVVSVKNRSELTRSFPHSAIDRARAYLNELRGTGYKPVIASEENHFLVRIRQKGFQELTFTVASYTEAEDAIHRIASERRQGLFIDYRAGHRITMAELIERYVREECPKHKGCDIETYTLKGFLADSRGELAAALAAQQRAIDNREKEVPVVLARRIPRLGLEWLHKPFAKVLPTDIEQYVHDRIDQEIKQATGRE